MSIKHIASIQAVNSCLTPGAQGRLRRGAYSLPAEEEQTTEESKLETLTTESRGMLGRARDLLQYSGAITPCLSFGAGFLAGYDDNVLTSENYLALAGASGFLGGATEGAAAGLFLHNIVPGVKLDDRKSIDRFVMKAAAVSGGVSMLASIGGYFAGKIVKQFT